MAKTATNISIDPELKRQSVALFSDLGMDLSTAITVFLRQAVRVQGLPFRVTREDRPNAATRAAMAEAEEILRHPERHKGYASADEMFADILSEEDDDADASSDVRVSA